MFDKETVCTCSDEALVPVQNNVNIMPMIGDDAPAFKADTTQGPISFPDDYKGKWVILFSHPADFTPVCTSEIAMFSVYAPEFKNLNTELVGISVDSVSSHLAWLKAIEDDISYKGHKNFKIDFPIVADMKMDVAKKYGMIQPHSSDTKTVRSVFFVDPQAKIRAMIIYPLSNGRNMDEIKRILIAMQTTDKDKVSTPANWNPGDEVVVPAPSNMTDMRKRKKECNNWFFCLKKTSN